MIDLDEIFETVRDPDPDVFTDEFRSLCQQLLQKIDLKRQSMQFSPYERDRVVIFVNEMYYSAFLNKNRRRLNDEPVFKAHLVGTLENMLNDQNMTGLTSLLSGLKHDDIEDLKVTAEKLFYTETYRHSLTMMNDSYLLRLQQNVFRIVSGITKVKKETRKQTKEETFRKLLQFIRDHGIRVGYVKIADRCHNIMTLTGHGEENQEKQLDIARETEEIYVPLARLFKIERSEAKLIRGCLQALNPQFLSDFDMMIHERTTEFLQPFKEEIRQYLQSDCSLDDEIPSIRFAERGLVDILHRSNIRIPFSELRLSDLPVDDLDPLFEIDMLVENPSVITQLIGRVIEKFAEQGEKLNLSAIELDLKRGAMVRIYNRHYHGRMYFRINDFVSEERSHRGLLANIDDKPPRGLHEGINAILASSEDEGVDILSMARKELLQPRITVYTPQNKSVELPNGATSLDFAAKIHEDVVKGALRVFVYDDIWGKNRREISLFDELPDGVMVFIESCLSSHRGKKPDPSAIKVDPGWLLFCQSGARTFLYRYLRANEDDAFTRGEVFLHRLSYICNEIPSVLLALVRRHLRQYEQSPDRNLIIGIGRGDINIVRLMRKLPLFAENESWTLRVYLQNQPMSLAVFTQELGANINIEQTDINPTEKNRIGMILLRVGFDPKKMELFEFIRRMLKMSYIGYSLSITRPDNPMKVN